MLRLLSTKKFLKYEIYQSRLEMLVKKIERINFTACFRIRNNRVQREIRKCGKWYSEFWTEKLSGLTLSCYSSI